MRRVAARRGDRGEWPLADELDAWFLAAAGVNGLELLEGYLKVRLLGRSKVSFNINAILIFFVPNHDIHFFVTYFSTSPSWITSCGKSHRFTTRAIIILRSNHQLERGIQIRIAWPSQIWRAQQASVTLNNNINKGTKIGRVHFFSKWIWVSTKSKVLEGQPPLPAPPS